MAPDQGDRRRARAPRERLPLRRHLHPLRPARGGAARPRPARRGASRRRASGWERRGEDPGGRGAAHAGGVAQRSLRRRGLALRAEVRRLPRHRRPRRHAAAHPLSPRRGRDRRVSRSRPRALAAARRQVRRRRRDRGAGRDRPPRLPAPAEARAAHRAARRGARRAGAARDPLPLRPACLRGLRPPPRPAARAQEAAGAPASLLGAAARGGPRGASRPRALCQRARAGAGGHRGQARAVAVSGRPLPRLAEGAHRPRRRLRGGGVHQGRRIAHRIRLGARGGAEAGGARLRGKGGRRVQREGADGGPRRAGRAAAAEAPLRRTDPGRARTHLGAAEAGGGGALQGDHRGRPFAAAHLPALSHRQRAGGVRGPRRAAARPRLARGALQQPRQGVLAGRGLQQGRPHRILPGHLALASPLPARPAGGADALSRRHRRQELLPERRAGVRAVVDPDGALLQRGNEARHRLLRLRRRGHAALRDQPRHHSLAPLGIADDRAAAPRLVHRRSRSQDGAVRRRDHARQRRARAVRGDRPAQLLQDQRAEGAARAGAARRAAHARAVHHARRADRGRRGEAARRHRNHRAAHPFAARAASTWTATRTDMARPSLGPSARGRWRAARSPCRSPGAR